MINQTHLSIRDDIFESITSMFGLNIYGFSQIELGYRNLKWKIETDKGDFFVKQYNKIRYPERAVQGLETALIHQSNLYKEGFPCPKLYSYRGKYVLKTPNGERFVLMGYCEGNIIKAGTANEDQMYSLGKIIGQMHNVLNSNNTVQLPLHWDVRSKESMMENWRNRWKEAISLDCIDTLSKLENQREIIEKNDIDIFSQCEKGWGHWDLFVDNMLFNPTSVSAILDFDRMHYVYPEFDISRPILSCCFEGEQLHTAGVSAFVKGYREYQKLSNEKLIRSIKLTWWKEAELVRVNNKDDSLPLQRFCEENNWVAKHWDELECLFAVKGEY